MVRSKNEIINIGPHDFEYLQYFIDVVRIRTSILFVEAHDNDEASLIDFQSYRSIGMHQELNESRYFHRRGTHRRTGCDRRNGESSQRETKLDLIEDHTSLQRFRIRTNDVKSTA